MFQFVPRFRHFGALVVGAVTLAFGAEISKRFDAWEFVYVLYVGAGALAISAGIWISALLREAEHSRYIADKGAEHEEQQDQRENLLAMARLIESLRDQPTDVIIQALARMFPEMGFDNIYIPPAAPIQTKQDGLTLQKNMPASLVADWKWQALAKEYFENNKSLAIRRWSEPEIGGPLAIFTKREIEQVRENLVQNKLASFDANREVVLNADGELWLRQNYYRPHSPAAYNAPVTL